MPTAELQAAFDANRATRQRSHPKAHSQTQSQSSASHSVAHSVRSSPRLNSRSRPLPEEHTSNGPILSSLPTFANTFVPPAHTRHVNDTIRAAETDSYAPSIPHHRRPAPSRSEPVGGWTFGSQAPSPRFKPLFGSFNGRLSVNSSPKIETAGLELESNTPQSPPFGTVVERVTRQRGKFGIGIDQPNNRSEGQSTLGQDQDGWFVVDMEATRAAQLSGDQPKLEFGHFGQSTSQRHDSRNPRGHRGEQIGIHKSPRDGRRSSFGENIGNGVGGGSSYRHGGPGFPSNPSGGSRRGGRGGSRGGYSGNRSGYHRSSISGSYRPPLPPLQHPSYSSPFEVIDPYAAPFGTDPYHPYYLSPTSPSYSTPMSSFGPPYAGPYGGYPLPARTPGGMYGTAVPPTGPTAVPPPIPMPVTIPTFPLDALRFYLLGQVSAFLCIS